MNLNFWLCVMMVMGRLQIFKPYLTLIERILHQLDVVTEADLERSRKWIQGNRDYPSLADFRNWYGYGWEHVVKMLVNEGKIIVDSDREIIYVGGEGTKLQDLVRLK